MASSAKQRRKQQLRQMQKRRGTRSTPRQNGQLPNKAVRMSDVVRHLAEPIVEELGDSLDDLERIISLTVAAWNLTLFAPDAQCRQFERLSKRLFDSDGEGIAMFRWICDVVAERRMQFYPHLYVTILDVHFTRESASSLYFEVAYTITQPPMLSP
ncbi:MAG: hypothetical protein ACYC6N_02210 [Pirellulaceae bacterium]